MTQPLCINCKYYDDGWIGDNYIGKPLCLRPIASLVSGIETLNKSPKEERTNGKCGVSAIFFKQLTPPKPKKFFFF